VRVKKIASEIKAVVLLDHVNETIRVFATAVGALHVAQCEFDSAAKAVDKMFRESVHSRYYDINFRSARSANAVEHAAKIGIPILKLKKAIELKDQFDEAVVAALIDKGMSEADAKSRKDQHWQNVCRNAPSNPKGHKAKAEKAKAKTAEPVEPAEPEGKADALTAARQQCNNLVIALNALIDQRGKASLDLTDLEEAIAWAAKVQQLLNPK
jgi:hypothetical protein